METAARFVSDPVWWFYLFWLPKYLVEQRGFTMVEMGMLAWIPYLSADLGALFGGNNHVGAETNERCLRMRLTRGVNGGVGESTDELAGEILELGLVTACAVPALDPHVERVETVERGNQLFV
jgi:hypothetical protein